MTEREKIVFRAFTAHLMTAHGLEFLPDDPVLPALFIIHKELTANNKGNNDVAAGIQQALAKLNPTVYNFSETGEAWKFAAARNLKWFYVGATIIALFWSTVLAWRLYHPVTQLLKRVQTDERGVIFLQFTKPKDSVLIIGKDYQQCADGSVRVYLTR